jgi:hypothetical protein
MEPHGHEEGAESSLAHLVVVVKFHKSQPVRPVVLQEIGEDPEVLLNILVDMLSLPIGLRVVCHQGVQLYAQKLQQVMNKVSHELCPLVTDHHFGQPEVLPSVEWHCLGPSTAGVLLITWTNEWNAEVQATTTN